MGQEDLGDTMEQEQISTTTSGTKQIQPGTVNKYNNDMRRKAGGDPPELDVLPEMGWTDVPCENSSMQKMKCSKNFPRNIGSTPALGGAGIAGMQGAGAAMESLSNLMDFEGGDETIPEKVKFLKRRYKASLKSPKAPTINAIITMFYMKLLMGGIMNSQNADLMEWKNFGPRGVLSTGD